MKSTNWRAYQFTWEMVLVYILTEQWKKSNERVTREKLLIRLGGLTTPPPAPLFNLIEESRTKESCYEEGKKIQPNYCRSSH